MEDPSVDLDTVRIRAACGCNVGPRKWAPPAYEPPGYESPNNDWRDYFDECGYEDEFDVDVGELLDEKEDGTEFLNINYYSMICPDCGITLESGCGHFEFA